MTSGFAMRLDTLSRERFMRITRRDTLDDVLAGPARYLASPDRSFSIGFITPLSRHFCATCNRVRVTVDGQLHLCLGVEQRVDLLPMLRGGCSDAEIASVIRAALDRKPRQHEFREAPEKLVRIMASTGG